MSYVEVKQLSKKFKDSIVINNQSFTIEKGEFVTLLGPSGCGKSTLLRCIAGLTDIEQGGSVIVGDVDLTWLQPKDRQVGMVFQSYALFPNMTLYENIAFGLKIKGMSKEQYDEKVKRMIEVVDLKGKENHYPHQLSGGQQQRVALARSLVVEPRILLLDEPLSALDAQIRKNLQIEIKKIQRELGITTIFVTHDQEEALMLSDRIFVMQEGIIVQSGTPEEIYSSPQTEFVARFIGHYNVLTDREWLQLTNLTPSKGTHYAIRPEVLKICSLPQSPEEKREETEEGKWVSGRIISKELKGNIIRYRVETSHHIILTVDELNTSTGPWNDTNILLWIPIQKCIVLEEGV